MTVLAVDPGMATAAAALFRCKRGSARQTVHPQDTDGLLAAARCLVGTFPHTTDAQDPEPVRLGQLAHWIQLLIVDHRVREVVVEWPATEGSYARNRKRQRTKGSVSAAGEAKLNRGIGAITAGAVMAGAAVVVQKADMQKKAHRKDEVNCLLRQAGQPELKNSHAADAAWLGMVHVGAWLTGRSDGAD